MTPLHPIADKREARARECLAAIPHSPNTDCGRHNVVFAVCSCDRHIRAMLAFATAEQQRISEGEVLEEAGKHWLVFKRAFLDRYAGWPAEGIEAMQALNRLLPNSCALISSPVAPDGEGGQAGYARVQLRQWLAAPLVQTNAGPVLTAPLREALDLVLAEREAK